MHRGTSTTIEIRKFRFCRGSMAAVFQWRHFHDSFERDGKVILAGEADGEGDLKYRAAAQELSLAFFNPHAVQVSGEGQTRFLLEQRTEIAFIEAESANHPIQSQLIPVVVMDEIDRLTDVRLQIAVRLSG